MPVSLVSPQLLTWHLPLSLFKNERPCNLLIDPKFINASTKSIMQQLIQPGHHSKTHEDGNLPLGLRFLSCTWNQSKGRIRSKSAHQGRDYHTKVAAIAHPITIAGCGGKDRDNWALLGITSIGPSHQRTISSSNLLSHQRPLFLLPLQKRNSESTFTKQRG